MTTLRMGVIDVLSDDTPCYSIAYPQVDVKLCMWLESVEEMQLEDIYTSIPDSSIAMSEDDECCSVFGFLFPTLGIDLASTVGGDGFLDLVLPEPIDEDEVESEWQEFVSARATLSVEAVTLSVTPDDIC